MTFEEGTNTVCIRVAEEFSQYPGGRIYDYMKYAEKTAYRERTLHIEVIDEYHENDIRNKLCG